MHVRGGVQDLPLHMYIYSEMFSFFHDQGTTDIRDQVVLFYVLYWQFI